MNSTNEVSYSKKLLFDTFKASKFIPETVILDFETAPRNALKKFLMLRFTAVFFIIRKIA
jgi:hypothetical protein